VTSGMLSRPATPGSSLFGLAELQQGEPLTHRTVRQTQATRLGTTNAPESPGNVPPRDDRVQLAISKGVAQTGRMRAEVRRLLPAG